MSRPKGSKNGVQINTSRINLRVPPETHQKLEQKAFEKKISISEIMRYLIERYLQKL